MAVSIQTLGAMASTLEVLGGLKDSMAKNKRSIPEIRARIREIADEYGIDELHDLADETYRNSPVTRARSRSVQVTTELAEAIRKYARRYPKLHQRDVAQHFDVNPGRVSEALNNLI